MSDYSPADRPEHIVSGQTRAPGTVQVRQSVVLAAAFGVFCFLGLMLWFVVSHATAILRPAQAAGMNQPGVIASAAPANPADLGAPQRSDALPATQVASTNPTPTTYATVSPQDLAGAPMTAPAAPPAPINPPAGSVADPSTTDVRPPHVSRAELLAQANDAAASSDLAVALPKDDLTGASSAYRSVVRQDDSRDPDQAPMSPYVLERGMVIPATLFTSIDSTIAGTVVAYVNQDVDDAQHQVVLIPRGSRVTGSYATGTIQGQRRLAVSWDSIKLPNGHTINLEGMPGIDLSGTSGFGAAVDNHTRRMFTNVALLSLLSADAQLSQPQNSNACGTGYCAPSLGQSVAGSVGTQIAQAGNAIVQRDANIAPTLHVVEGAQVAIMVERDLPLHPWTENP